MLSLLFAICMIWFVGKFFVFGLRASWGIMKLLLTVIFFPLILIGMVIRLLVLMATVSFFLLLAGATVLIRAAWVRAATTGRVHSVRRSPTALVA